MSVDCGLWRPSTAQRRVVRHALAAFDCREDELGAGKRRLAVGRARQAAVWALNQRWPLLTTSQLAAAVKLGDHSTAVYARQTAEKRRLTDMAFHALTEALVHDLPLPERGVAPEELVLARLKVWAEDEDDGLDAEQRRDELVGEAHFGGIAVGSVRLLAALKQHHPERFPERMAA